MRIRPMAGVRVVHRFPVQNRVLWLTERWQATVEWVDRPETGTRSAQITCAACGEQVGFQLYSQEAARTRRRRQLFGALWTGVGFFAVFTSIGLIADEQPWDMASFLALLAIAAVVSTPWLYFAGKETGTVIHGDRKNGPHSFTIPDVLNAMDEPVPYGFPPRSTVVFDDELVDEEDS